MKLAFLDAAATAGAVVVALLLLPRLTNADQCCLSSSCNTPCGADADRATQWIDLSPEELETMIADGSIDAIYDVRNECEWTGNGCSSCGTCVWSAELGHIPGATWIGTSGSAWDETSIPTTVQGCGEAKIAVYCTHGCRAKNAILELRKRPEFQNAVIYRAIYNCWASDPTRVVYSSSLDDSVVPSCSVESATSTPTTEAPTAGPTSRPSLRPTLTRNPTSGPSFSPTSDPTSSPTSSPTGAPTPIPPTSGPTMSPTSGPTTSPTSSPTGAPTPIPPCGDLAKDPCEARTDDCAWSNRQGGSCSDALACVSGSDFKCKDFNCCNGCCGQGGNAKCCA